MVIKEFIPPIFLKLKLKSNKQVEFFSSYEAALEKCGRTGYENEEIVNVVFHKTNRLKENAQMQSVGEHAAQSLLGILYFLQQTKAMTIKVLDFGGACGAHYFLIRRIVDTKISMHWAVVETPKMTKKAKLLETKELKFYGHISDAMTSIAQCDLFHSSGAIQYVPDPQKTLEEIVSCGAKFLSLNRLALSTKEKIIVIQESLLSANGPGEMTRGIQDRICKYPITYFPKEALETIIKTRYVTKFTYPETKGHIAGFELMFNGGFLAERVL
jgi:putative methyltransferase (TIGR04325 family)